MGFRRVMMGECSLIEMTSKLGPKLELEPTFSKEKWIQISKKKASSTTIKGGRRTRIGARRKWAVGAMATAIRARRLVTPIPTANQRRRIPTASVGGIQDAARRPLICGDCTVPNPLGNRRFQFVLLVRSSYVRVPFGSGPLWTKKWPIRQRSCWSVTRERGQSAVASITDLGEQQVHKTSNSSLYWYWLFFNVFQSTFIRAGVSLLYCSLHFDFIRWCVPEFKACGEEYHRSGWKNG